MRVLFGYFLTRKLCILIDVWLGEDQRTNTIKILFGRDWTTSSHFINYFTINSACKWEYLCIRSRNQQNMHFSMTIIELR